MLEAYDIYKIFIAVKQHFNVNSEYDFFKYNGNIRTSKSAFLNRKDKGVYFRLLKKLRGDLDEIRNYLFLSMMYDNTGSISKYVNEDFLNAHNRFLQSYYSDPVVKFTEDIERSMNKWKGEDLDLRDVISCSDGSVPILFTEVFSKEITPVIPFLLNKVLPVYEHWNENADVFHPFMSDKLNRLMMMNELLDRLFGGLAKKQISSIMKTTI